MNFHCCLLSHFFLNSAANYDELQWSSAKVYERNNIPQTSRSQRSQAKRFKQEGKWASCMYIHQGILTCSCFDVLNYAFHIYIFKVSVKELHVTNQSRKDVARKQEFLILMRLLHQVLLWLEVQV